MYPHAHNNSVDGRSHTELNREKLKSSVNELTGVCPVEVTNASTGDTFKVNLEHHPKYELFQILTQLKFNFSLQSYLVSIRYARESRIDDLVSRHAQIYGAHPRLSLEEPRQHYQFRT